MIANISYICIFANNSKNKINYGPSFQKSYHPIGHIKLSPTASGAKKKHTGISTGKDSIVSQPSLIPVSSRKAQYEVSIKKDGNIIERFTPFEVRLYRQGSKTYYYRIIKINGEKRQVMMERALKSEYDSLSIYRFSNDRKSRIYYYQFSNKSEVYPMAEPDMDYERNIFRFVDDR